MGRLHNQIDNVKHQIEMVGRDLDVLFEELGMLVAALRQPIASELCEQPYLLLAQAKSEHGELCARTGHLAQIGEQITHAATRIAELKDKTTKEQKRLAVVHARLGVIAWEESASQVLAESLVHLIPQVNEHQKRIADMEMHHRQVKQRIEEVQGVKQYQLRLEAWIIATRLRKVTDTSEGFFIETGRAIAEAGCIRQLASELAPQLEEEHSVLSRELAGWNEEIFVLKQTIHSNRTKLEAEGVAGSVGRKVQELQDAVKASNERMRSLAIAYGKVICQLPDPWKGTEVGSAVLRCYDQIRRHERVRAQLEKRIHELEVEIDISELLLIISQDEERIDHLQQTIDQFNRQVMEIKTSIREKREKIGLLKKGQNPALEAPKEIKPL